MLKLSVMSAHIWVVKREWEEREKRHEGGNAKAPSMLQMGRAKAPGSGECTHPLLQLPPCQQASRAEPCGPGWAGVTREAMMEGSN